MAKLRSNKMLIRTISGPSGELNFGGGPDDTMLSTWGPDLEPGFVKRKPNTVPRRREYRRRHKNPLLLRPPTLYADCDAWTVADQTYTNLGYEERMAWRVSVGRPGFSPYDAYMKSAMPHLLRGYPAPDRPHKTTGWALDRLEFPDDFIHGRVQEECTALPPISCQTSGLHFAAVDWRRVTIFQEGRPEEEYGVRVYMGFSDGHPKEPTAAMTWMQVWVNLGSDPSQYPSPLVWYESQGETFYVPAKPLAISLHVCPCRRVDVTDEVYEETIPVEGGTQTLRFPDYSREVVVEYLDRRENFVHWPRWWPSKKADAVPENLGYLNRWEDDEYQHWWPKE